MTARILYCFVSLVLFATLDSCRKQKNEDSFLPMPDLPTENLDGSYLWHGKISVYDDGKDIEVEGIVAEEINVINDSTLMIISNMNYNSNQQPEYKCRTYNDSELIFRLSANTITYKFKRNLVVWNRGTSILYGVPGQTTKWDRLHRPKLIEDRAWHRTGIDYYITSGIKVVLPDTIGSAFLLFGSVSAGRSMWLAGADSTGVVYHTSSYDAGPNIMSINGKISYFVSNDSISMYTSPASPFGSSYTFHTY
ncbi:MAG: hypothetical protein K9G49_12255 [Taibaiella sp.]|nr:hypothetical protein [Taibaiella sp.]